jgi:hypothetical protein
MSRILLFAGGVLNLALAVFKIAMPYLFHWREALGSSSTSMWAILYGENLGISLLLLFFAAISIFQWRELPGTSVGKTLLLSIAALWAYRTIAEIVLFKIGVDGAWWRVLLFLVLAVIYFIPLITAMTANQEHEGEQVPQ